MNRWMSALMVAGLAGAGSIAVAGGLTYPETTKVDVADEYFGVSVEDPYRWLENDVRKDDRVAEWVEAQNKVTFGFLGAIDERERINRRLTELWDYEKFSSPSKVADYYVFAKNDGLQPQSVVYKQDALDAEPEVLLNPNEWSAEGIIALSGTSFSESGDFVAFAQSTAGSDWREWRVMNVRTGEWLDDSIKWVKWGGASWTHDDRGFFYSRFPEPEAGQEFQSLNMNQSVWYHRIGTDQSEDVLVHADADHPDWNFYGFVTEDGRYLVIYVSIGTDDRNRLYVKDLAEPYGAPVAIIDDFENEWSPFANEGSRFYFKTDLDALNGRVVAFDINEGPEALVELIGERDEALKGVSMTGNMIVCSYLKDVLPLVKMHRPDGSHVRDVAFPGIGSGGGFGGKRSDTETFYSFSSINRPPTIFRYDMITGASEVFRQPNVPFNPDDYTVKQVFYSSKDGTRVPMFIAHKKGLELDGSNATLLYGYGGFNISMTPYFSPTRVSWMDLGGVFAVACLRGGGEYGNAWHEAGKKMNKQNVFDDFIAAGEHLIDVGYTSSDKLAILGGSNGGLLVGACMIQRPDLFAAAIPAVGVMDMLRFDQFTAGRYWTDDYGSSSDSPEMFEYLHAYSPYHALRDDVEYPATLVTTADTDDRVVPGHSFKFAARLQEAHRGDNPVLIRIQTKAGHGAGKPTAKIIEEYADMWAFLVRTLDMDIGR